MKKFEYKVEVLCGSNEKVNSLLNELGKQGWELISIDRGSSVFAYFKRTLRRGLLCHRSRV